ncbi:MAG: hypothetical protein ACRDJC_11875 [Thermomicrobiales bacterium]
MVCPSGCPYSSIQQALLDSADQRTPVVSVCPGTYTETISVNFRQVILTGAGPEQTTINAHFEGSAITVFGGALLMRGFTITGGRAVFGGGVHDLGSLTLQNCVITGNTAGAAAGGGGGINNGDHAFLGVVATQVTENSASNGNGGGILNDGGIVQLRDASQVTKSHAADGGGIFNQSNGIVSLSPGVIVSGNEPDNCVGTAACGA